MTHEDDTSIAPVDTDWEALDRLVGTVLTPSVPIGEYELFAGRMQQIQDAVEAINQRGQHAVIYGERGVGKTSLANILASRIKAGIPVLSPRVNCDSTDDFGTLWQKVFAQVDLVHEKRSMGFQAATSRETVAATESIGPVPTPDDVRRLLAMLADDQVVVVIFDEFDRVKNPVARRAMADTIKALSDHDIRATIVVVGVADTVGELLAEHRSIERAMAQIPMPRMSALELEEILSKGTSRAGMSITESARRQIGRLAQGLPHYAHLLGLHAARHAIADVRLEIDADDVLPAVHKAVDRAQQSLRDDYRLAVSNPQRDGVHGRVLLACAQATTDEFGFFSSRDVRASFDRLVDTRPTAPGLARQLNDFCKPSRGAVLTRSGEPRKYLYRFTSPLMQPFVKMKGLVDGAIVPD